MTTFGDSDAEDVRTDILTDESLGSRPKLNDFMQVRADHHPRTSPVDEEPLCFDEGKDPLHWKGLGRPPTKKVSYVRLSATYTLTMGNVGFKLVGAMSTESTDRLLAAEARLAETQRIGTQKSLKRMREETHELSSRSDVCLHLPFVVSSMLTAISIQPHRQPLPSALTQLPRLAKLLNRAHDSSTPHVLLSTSSRLWTSLKVCHVMNSSGIQPRTPTQLAPLQLRNCHPDAQT